MTFACIFKVNNYVSFFYLTAFVHIFRNLVRCQYENLQLWPWYLGNKLTMSQVTAESCFWVTHYSLGSSSPRRPWKRQSLWLFSLAVLGFIITASKYSKWLWLKKCSSEDVLFFAPTVRHQQLLLSRHSLVQNENPFYHKGGAQGSACLCLPGMCVEVSTSPILPPFIRVLEIKLGSFHWLGNTSPPGPSPWPPALSGSSLFLPVLLFFS